MDMHSGGGQKEEWPFIIIEAPEDEARVIFYNRFGHNPERVTCTCCGEDYSISEEDSLEQATAYDRNCEHAYFRPDGTECQRDEAWKIGSGCAEGYSSGYVERQNQSKMRIRLDCNTTDDEPWGLYMTLDEYLASGEVLVIRADEIKDEERKGDVPVEGYVWQGD